MKITTLVFAISASLCCSTAALAMTPMSDDELQAEVGQALFSMSTIGAGANGNPQANIGFYKLSMEAQLALNANIKRLQLGCGGEKPAGATGAICDIDISDIRLTGVVPSLAAGASGVDAGPASDFILNNPFIEFAIKNPNSASTREIVGFRLGAASALGTMSFGENPTSSNADDTGINSISGQLPTSVFGGTVPIRITSGILSGGTGTAYTKSYNPTYDDIDPNNGNQDAGWCGGFLQSSCNADNSIRGPIHPYQKQLVLNRAQQIVLDNDSRSGRFLNLYANVRVLINIEIRNINALINQDLKYIHEVKIRDQVGGAAKNFALSLQKENVIWQNQGIALNGGFGQQATFLDANGNGTTGYTTNNYETFNAPAQKGWWLNLPQAEVSNWTGAELQISSNDALSTLFGSTQTYNNLDLGQQPIDNCYGSLTFC